MAGMILMLFFVSYHPSLRLLDPNKSKGFVKSMGIVRSQSDAIDVLQFGHFYNIPQQFFAQPFAPKIFYHEKVHEPSENHIVRDYPGKAELLALSIEQPETDRIFHRPHDILPISAFGPVGMVR
jgi:hypothetical protein